MFFTSDKARTGEVGDSTGESELCTAAEAKIAESTTSAARELAVGSADLYGRH